MKKLILCLLLITSFLNSESLPTNDIGLFFKIKDKKVQLKWIPQKYSNLNTYKLYKSINGKDEKLIATLKAKEIQLLKKDKYSEDYIFSIHPFKDVKNLDEQLKATLAEEKIAGFRILRFMQDNEYAKNLGQYYEDDNIKSLEVYKYRLELYKNDKLKSEKSITINKKSKVFDSIAWINKTVDNLGVTLSWDSGRINSFFNVYRKLDNESSFRRMNKNSIYVPALNTAGKREIFMDTTLKDNQEASYKVKKVDFFGTEVFESAIVEAKKTIVKKIDPLYDISVYNTDKKKTIRWEKRKDALGYNVYTSEKYNSKAVKVNKKLISNNFYFDRNFKVNKNSFYYVTVVTKNGESSPSAKILSYAKDVSAPKAPKHLIFNVKAGEVNLSWDEVKDNGLIGYRIYVSMDQDAKEWARLEKYEIKDNKYTHSKSKAHSRFHYYYKISAVDKKFNESPFSNVVKVKLPDVIAPKQPLIKSYKTYENKIVFNWQEIHDYDLSHYNLYVQEGKNFVKLNKEPLTITYFELQNLKYQGLRKYLITAVDKSGNESSKQEHSLIRSLDLTAPKIENIKYVQKYKNLYISFDVNDKDYNGFEVFRSTLENKNFVNISSFKRNKSFINKNINKNRKYFYYIKVYDKSGNVKVSDVKEILWK